MELLSGVRIPSRVCRKLETRQALGVRPLEQATRTDAARIKRIPVMLTNALPAAFRLWRPIAMRTADARVFRALLVIVKNLLVDVWLNNRSRKAELRLSLCTHIH